jgi:hypothetical protein
VALAICLLPDPRTERAVRQLWQRLEDHGVPTLLSHTHGRHVPHLSYAVLRTFDVDDVRRAVARLPGRGAVHLHFDTVGHFRRGRAAMIAAVTSDTLSRQAGVVDAAESTGADLHHHYRPGRWVPHLGVSTGVRGSDVGWLTTAVHDIMPLDAVAERAALVDSGTGEQWPLESVP